MVTRCGVNSIEREIERISGEKVRLCYQCGKCTNGCLFSEWMDIPPHMIMKLIQYGDEDALLKSSSIWICATCETCSARCPNGIDIARSIDTLRQIAQRKGVKPAVKEIPLFHKCFLANIQYAGRVSEPVLMGLFKTASMKITNDIGLAVDMLKKNKLRLVPQKIKNPKSVSKIFSGSKSIEENSFE